MSDENIFNEPTTPEVVEPPKPPVVPDHLKELIGEGKKYASVEKALESLPHKESHIEKIERENAEMRQKVQEAIAIEEVYRKLVEPRNPDGVTPPAAVVDEASLASLLDRKLSERDAEQKAKANVARVKEALVSKYGDKAEEVYKEKAKEFGVSAAFLNDIVRRSPKAAEELFGIKPKDRAAGSTPPGSVNSSALNNNRPSAKPQLSPLSGGDLMTAWNAAKSAIKE
jgi:hypothetical protein